MVKVDFDHFIFICSFVQAVSKYSNRTIVIFVNEKCLNVSLYLAIVYQSSLYLGSIQLIVETNMSYKSALVSAVWSKCHQPKFWVLVRLVANLQDCYVAGSSQRKIMHTQNSML